jgi:hypothetical protein
VLALAAVATAAPAVHARGAAHSGVRADHVGATVRDIHGRWIGTVCDIEYDSHGDVIDVVITLGVLPGGGKRYVVVPRDHLEDSGTGLRFRGARERLIDAPRHAEDPARR